jgi:hypothetical protein
LHLGVDRVGVVDPDVDVPDVVDVFQLGTIRSGSRQSAIRIVASSRRAVMKSGGSPWVSTSKPSRSR